MEKAVSDSRVQYLLADSRSLVEELFSTAMASVLREQEYAHALAASSSSQRATGGESDLPRGSGVTPPQRRRR